MPVFHDAFSRAGRPALMQTFSQSVVYTKTTGATRTIDAVVIRDGWTTLPGTNDEVPFYEVHVANDLTSGISAGELVVGKETLSFAIRAGQASVSARTIIRIVSHDEGMLVLECR